MISVGRKPRDIKIPLVIRHLLSGDFYHTTATDIIITYFLYFTTVTAPRGGWPPDMYLYEWKGSSWRASKQISTQKLNQLEINQFEAIYSL